MIDNSRKEFSKKELFKSLMRRWGSSFARLLMGILRKYMKRRMSQNLMSNLALMTFMTKCLLKI